jgi:hypothetical protein
MRALAALLVVAAGALAGEIGAHLHVAEILTERSATARQTLAAPVLPVGRDGLFMAVGFALDKPDRREAHRIKVSIRSPDGESREAAIVGGVEAMRCTFFRLAKGEPAPDPVPMVSARLKVGEKVVLLTRHGPLMEYGLRRVDTVVEAVVEEPRLYYALRNVRADQVGSVVVTTDGRLVGFIDVRATYPEGDGLMMGVGSSTAVVVPADAYRGLEPRKLAKKAWLGVNLAPFDKSREDYFGVAGDWKGAMITGISTQSPAAQAGARVFDLLQRIGDYEFRYEITEDWEEMLRNVQRLPLGRPLPCRIVRFEEQPDGSFKSKVLDLEIVMGERPLDFEDAPETEIKDFGLTVKPVTDDWRRRLNLPAGLPGAVVTRMVRGLPANLAGLSLNDLIQAVDREPVADPAALKRLVDKAKKAKRKKVLLLVRRGRQTAFIAVSPNW